MTLTEYIEHLQKLLIENPAVADAEVWSSSDEEGNSFRLVCVDPTINLISKADDYIAETCVGIDAIESDIYNELLSPNDYSSEAEYKQACADLLQTYKQVVVID